MKTRIILDTRRSNKDGLFPLKISVSNKGQTALVSLDKYISLSQWEQKTSQVIKHPNSTFLNNHILRIKVDVDTMLMQAEKECLSIQDIKKRIVGVMHPTVVEPTTLLTAFVSFASTKTGRTREIYNSTLNRILDFDPHIDNKKLEGVDEKWLSAFDKFLMRYAPAVNARNIHLRNIRAVYNYAINEELTTHYPFRKFKIKHQATPKRALTVEQLRNILNSTTDSSTQEFIDMFMLSFFLIGINLVDLVHLRELQGNRIEYYRSKTKRLYSIKVEQEAMDIIHRYRGDGYLLNIMNRYKDYRNYTKHINKALKRIAPALTTYWARHTWASIAVNDLDAPFDVVSKALGHSTTTGASVTSVYVDYDMRKVDALNRAMIDWVLYGKK